MKYKQMAIMLAVLLMSAGIPSLKAQAANVCMSTVSMIGDANQDGSISVTDAVKLQRFLLTKDSDISMNADLNGDGIINVFDLVFMKRMLLGTYQPEDYTKLVINEICASNGESLISADGNSPDWIEIYNGSATDVHLSGYGLSDGTKKLFKYRFPENTVIKSGEYLTVLCDGDGIIKIGEGELLAPFNISNKKSETICLTHPKNGTLDMVTVPIGIKKDTTYGRYQDRGFKKLTATPNRSNDSAVVTLDSPVFSQESGFYDSSFDLSLSGTDGTVYYTLDNTDPRTSNTAIKYNNSINIHDVTSQANVYSALENIVYPDSITEPYHPPTDSVDKGMVVRAVVKDNDGNFSDVVSKTYFVGQNQSYYQDMKVISIVTEPDNLFSDEKGIYTVGEQEKRSAAGDCIEQFMYSNFFQRGKEWERPVSVQLFEHGSLAYANEMGMRIAGNWTRNTPQKSLRLFAKSKYGASKLNYPLFDGLTDYQGRAISSFDVVTLRNGGNNNSGFATHDDFIQELVKDRAVAVQASADSIVFLDGEFWGYYSIRERLDEEYIASHYGVLPENVEIIKYDEVNEENSYVTEWNDMLYGENGFLYRDMSDEANYQEVCEKIDIQSYIDFVAIETYICNYDSGNNNWSVWRTNHPSSDSSYHDGKWRFMLYDTDCSAQYYLGGVTATRAKYDMLGAIRLYPDDRSNIYNLFAKLIENENFRNQFYQSYTEIMENNFKYDNHLKNLLNSYQNRQKDAILATKLRFNGLETQENASEFYDRCVNTTEQFFKERQTYATEYLNMLINRCDYEPLANNALDETTAWISNTGNLGAAHYTNQSFSVLSCVDSGDMESRVYRDHVWLNAGQTYTFHFTVNHKNHSSNQSCKLYAYISGNDFSDKLLLEPVTVTADGKNEYTFTITPSKTYEMAEAGFIFGSSCYDQTYYFNDVSLIWRE